jgi:GEVED domain/Secretion system C-terminal sorting domain
MKKQLPTISFRIKCFLLLIATLSIHSTNAQILYDNGPYFNNVGTGAGGANESALYNTTFGMGTIGFGHQAASFNRVADDFIVTDCKWRIDSIVFFAYQTGSTTTSTITSVNVRIWNNAPNAPGSSVVFGDTTTNRLTRSVWSGAYRMSETTVGNTSRPIMRNVCAFSNVVLSADTFWVDWSSTGSLGSGPWAPPRTPVNVAVSGNGKQRIGSIWNNALDGGTGNPAQGFPFIIYGRKIKVVAKAGIDSAYCNNSIVTLGASPSGTGGLGALSYAWSPSLGLNNATIANPLLTVNGNNNYILTVIDSLGCIGKDTIAISTLTAPTVTITATSDTLCTGQSTILSGGGANTYIWNNGVINGVSFIPGGTTTYTVTGTGANGCSNTASQTIIVNTLPVVTATMPAAICSGSNTSLNANAMLSGTFCQPTYTNGTGFGDYISRVQLNTLLVNSLGAASPYYTLFPDTGSATTTLVAGVTDTIRFRAGTYSQNDFAAWIDYNQNNVFEVSEKLGQVLNLGVSPAEGKIGFTVPVSAFNGKTRMRVRELDGAVASIVIDPCTVQSGFGEVEDYTITITGGVTSTNISYAWSPATFLSSTTVSNPTVTAATTTTNYIVTATSTAGCIDTAQVAVTVKALPPVTANTSAPAVCTGGTVSLTGSGAITYTWNNSVSNGVSFVPVSTNTYTVTGTDANGCSKKDSVTITVNPLPIVTANATAPAICAGQSTTLTGGGAVSYVWNNGAINGVAISPSGTTTYTVTGTDANTCSNTATQTITVNTNPVASLTAPVSILCAGTPATLTGLPAGGTYTVVSGSASALVANVFNASVVGPYTIAYTSTNAAGCSDSAQFNFNVNCILGLDNTIINNPSLTIFPNPNNGSFTINSNVEIDGTIELINELGQVVYKNRMNGLSQNINVQNVTVGIYHLRITNGSTPQMKRLSIVK